MKKFFLTTSFLALFILTGSNVSAQASENASQQIDTAIINVVAAIQKNKALKETEIKNYIARFEAVASFSKSKEEAITIFEKEYEALAHNYAKKTGKTLPSLPKE